MDEPEQMEFSDVLLIVDTGLVLKCRVGETVVSVPPLRMLSGTTIRRAGDRGTLVLPTDVAEDLGLARRFSSTDSEPTRSLPVSHAEAECLASCRRATHAVSRAARLAHLMQALRMARTIGAREIGRRLLQPELLLPQQYAASCRPLTGSQRLMAAVLEDAIALLCRPPKPRSGRAGSQTALIRDAARWFRADDRRSAFSFLRVCEALDLDPFCVRRLVLRGMPEDGSGRLGARIRRTRLARFSREAPANGGRRTVGGPGGV